MEITLLRCPELRVGVGLLAWAELDATAIEMAWHHLAADDAAGIRRRRYEADRMRSLGARIALTALWAELQLQAGSPSGIATSRTTRTQPASVGMPVWPILSQLRKDTQGRPWLAARGAGHMPAIGFSHAGAWSACVMSDAGGLVGVDIEQQPEDPEGLGSVFSTQESDRLCAVASTATAEKRAMLRGWTIKEATLKAAGCGFLTDPRAWQIGTGWPMTDDAGTICGPQGMASWRHLESPAGYVLTVARLD